MGVRINVARFAGATAPEVQSMQYDSAETFLRGAVIIFESGATGEIVEGGADPTPIVGIALEDADSKPGFAAANSPATFTGRVREVSVARANRTTIFSGRAVNGATDPVTPALTNVNAVYGLLKSGNDWVVDIAETSNTRVEIVDIDIDNLLFFFKFMEAHLATP